MTLRPISSRLSGWHKLSRRERLNILKHWLDDRPLDLSILDSGGLSTQQAESLIENVCGLYSLPFSVAPNFVINDEDLLVPMVIEEPSVVAAASNAARLARHGGGFHVESSNPIMIEQIQITLDDPEKAARIILEHKAELLDIARQSDPTLIDLGGGPLDLECRQIGRGGERYLILHLLVDVRDAMGANTINTMGEAIAPKIEALTGGKVGLCIISNLADRRLVTVKTRIPFKSLKMKDFSAEQVRDGIVAASRFAELDPYRAATHNKGVMNGIDAVLLATGNDWRAVEAGAHAFAAKDGGYHPLSVWWSGDNGDLRGRLTIPMAVGIVGGATRVQAVARLALELIGADSATKLAAVAAAAGLANNLAALRSLATEGIQKGHMRLHQRSRHLTDKS